LTATPAGGNVSLLTLATPPGRPLLVMLLDAPVAGLL
jgi:hypothetical protein